MSECIDRKFEKMLYAYELGMLGDDQREELEIHLLECIHCNKRAQNFRSAAQILRHDSEIREPIKEMAEAQPAALEADHEVEKKFSFFKRPIRAYVPATAVAAIILLVFILKPWHIEISPTKEASAIENRLAVMYFNYLSDDEDTEWFGEAVTSLLITDLSESHYIQVVSSQRIHDVLNRLGGGGAKRVDRDIATRIAGETRAKWMQMGDIIKEGSEITITSQLIDATTGTVAASQRVHGGKDATIFALVDSLSSQVRADLNLPVAAKSEPDPDVADITTHSPEAYKLYLEGVAFIDRFYPSDAMCAFDSAIKLDPKFAMAYYHLSNLASKQDGLKLIDMAAKLAKNAGRKEQLLIASRAAIKDGDYGKAIKALEELTKSFPDEKEAYYQLSIHTKFLGDLKSAIHYAERAIEIDPLYKNAVNQLAYNYQQVGRIDDAIATVDQYIALVPDEPNPYDSKGEIFAYSGKIDLAIESFMMALEKEPRYFASRATLAHMYLYKRDFPMVEQQICDLVKLDTALFASWGQYFTGVALAYQGKLDQAIDVLAQDTSMRHLWTIRFLRWFDRNLFAAGLHWEKKEYKKAITKFKMAMDTFDEFQAQYESSFLSAFILLLYEAGKSEKALYFAEHWEDAANDTANEGINALLCNATLAFAEGDFNSAIVLFDKATHKSTSFYTYFMLGRSYLEAKEYEKAAIILGRIHSSYPRNRAYWFTWDVKINYYLGIANEEMGNNPKAIHYYEEFLDAWKDADPGIAVISDAQTRLARLIAKP
jgi:tetratricopeptide (TPR) repeat protein